MFSSYQVGGKPSIGFVTTRESFDHSECLFEEEVVWGQILICMNIGSA